jgi:hypothetical protein
MSNEGQNIMTVANTHLGECNRDVHFRQDIAPDIFNGTGKLLYVGAKPKKSGRLCQLMRSLAKIYHVTILEIYTPNVEALNNHKRKGRHFHEVIEGDVRETKDIFDKDEFDHVIWWHGPEHVTLDELPQALSDLEYVTKKSVNTACPWGISKQGAVYGNEYEIHQQPMYPKYFLDCGYSTWTEGSENGRIKSNLVARKVLTKEKKGT